MRAIERARPIAAAALLGAGLWSCGGEAPRAAEPDGGDAVMVSPENVAIARTGQIESGPTISGTLQPEQEANVRAEVSGSVLETYADQGERVTRGALLVRLDEAALRDSFLSARSAVTTAEQSAQLAHRNLQRAERLAAAGAVAERELENAQLEATSAESQLADARARLALARDQLENARVESPITGIVSERAVSGGDVVQPGAALYTIVDPTSMQLEAAFPSAELALVETGAPVEFTVNGYPGRVFVGRVHRIDPTADPATGQVTIFATIPNAGGDLVGGLFAEGRIAAEQHTGIIAPLSAVELTGQTPTVLRVKRGVVERIAVDVGIRDEQGERIELLAGIAEGDTLLIGAARGMTEGTPVRIQAMESTPAR